MGKSREPDREPAAGARSLHVTQPDLGDQLKAMFGEMSSGPMPSRLLELADRLEEAFQRGDLVDTTQRRPRAS